MLKRARRRTFVSVLAWLSFALMSTATLAAGAKFNVTWDASLTIGMPSATSQSELKTLLTRPWRIDATTYVFDVANPEGTKEKVRSCRTLFQADVRKMVPVAYSDRAQYRSWAINCYAIRSVAQASAATRSYVTDFTMDKSHVKKLPVELAFVISNDDKREVRRIRAAGGTLGAYIAHASIAPSDSQRVSHGAEIKDDSGGMQGLSWRASGDFNHDGVQDLLISTYNHVTGGDYVAYGLYVVTRLDAHAPMIVIKKFPVMGPDVIE